MKMYEKIWERLFFKKGNFGEKERWLNGFINAQRVENRETLKPLTLKLEKCGAGNVPTKRRNLKKGGNSEKETPS